MRHPLTAVTAGDLGILAGQDVPSGKWAGTGALRDAGRVRMGQDVR